MWGYPPAGASAEYQRFKGSFCPRSHPLGFSEPNVPTLCLSSFPDLHIYRLKCCAFYIGRNSPVRVASLDKPHGRSKVHAVRTSCQGVRGACL